MVGRSKQRRMRIGWRRVGIATGCVGLVAGALYWLRGGTPPPAVALPAPVTSAARPAATPPPPDAAVGSDYATRVVAYLYHNEAVTRAELGEYLIARFGPEKLKLLVNQLIIDDACRKNNIEVTAGDIENALGEDLKGLNINRATFVSTVLKRYKKSLYEWREDVLRPKLQLGQLCRNRVHVEDRDVLQAYETAFGEKLQGRLIIYPADQKQQALEEYTRLRDSEEAFHDKAGHQELKTLAATWGRINPFGRHTMGKTDDGRDLDDIFFRLRPGQVSEIIGTPQGLVIFKCDQRIPADTSHSMQAERPKLVKDIIEKKLQVEVQKVFLDLLKEAAPQYLLKRNKATDEVYVEGDPPAGGPASSQVIATFGKATRTPVTREHLGEYLIARFGAEKLELMLNKRMIDKACRERGIAVTAQEIDAELAGDLDKLKMDVETFKKEFLSKHKKSLYEWREDVVRPRIQMVRLCRDRVRCTDDDVRTAFEAYHGEKMECRIIIWPLDQQRFAMAEYPKLRDSDAEFDRAARGQASPSLAANGGRIKAFGRHTMGDENLEREAFKLQPGEVSTLIGTAQGIVMLKCDRRLPPDRNVNVAARRPQLVKEILEKKTQQEMQVVMRELRVKATPRPLLVDPNRPVDITEETRRELSEVPPDEKDKVPVPHRVGAR